MKLSGKEAQSLQAAFLKLLNEEHPEQTYQDFLEQNT
jgi:hypothetical protein